MSVPSDLASPRRRVSRPSTIRKTAGLGLALVVGVGGSSWWLTRGDTPRKAASPPAEGAATNDAESAVRINVVKPRTGGLTRLTSQPGSVHAFESVDLFAKASGFLKTQAVDIGAVVKQGDVLAVIDAPELEKAVDEATAAVEQARAKAALAEAHVATTEAERDAAAANLTQAKADIAQQVARRLLSEKQFNRIKGLHAREAVTKELVDEHEHDLQSTRAAERLAQTAALTAKAQLAAAQARVLQAIADVAEAKTAIRLAEARAERAGVMNGYTRITAPFDGVISARFFHPGAFIRSAADGSSTPLLTVMRIDRMRVVVQVPDLDVALLDPGDPATVVVDALKNRSFSGSVSRLARAENSTMRTMRVEIDLENPGGLLCEGMCGRATIELRPASKGLAVPASCVLGHSTSNQAKVYVVRDARVQAASVSVGADDGATIKILSGLGPDDLVVLNPRGVSDDGAVVVANLIPG
jgi:RND family efflux transporter MFP subunit